MPPQSRSQRVAANVRAEMARHRHTQISLAKELDCTQQSLSLRLNGKVPFRIDELDRIALILEVGLADLIGGEDVEAAS